MTARFVPALVSTATGWRSILVRGYVDALKPFRTSEAKRADGETKPYAARSASENESRALYAPSKTKLASRSPVITVNGAFIEATEYGPGVAGA
ncbi:MAG: hypothetical protein JO347_03740 [Candidatus Eremiobacteraeota bacterium]|nr:hypothetical protein [Candidatus Eremiobacteraeota bacterium]